MVAPSVAEWLQDAQELASFNAYMANMGLKLDSRQVEDKLDTTVGRIVATRDMPVPQAVQLNTIFASRAGRAARQ